MYISKSWIRNAPRSSLAGKNVMMKKSSKNGNLEMYTSKSWIRNVTVQRTWRAGKHVRMIVFGFWFVVPPQLAIQVQQERIQVVRSNRVARKRPAKSNGTPAMDLGHEQLVLKRMCLYVASVFRMWHVILK